MAEDLLPTDPESVGPYRLIGRLGTGGMGQVYLARSPGEPPGGGQGHPAGTRGRPRLPFPFRARGQRRAQRKRDFHRARGGRGPRRAAAVAGHGLRAGAVAGGRGRGARSAAAPASCSPWRAGLAEALAAIHAAGLVHRDLKPSNVLLAADGPRVIDFGISRAVDASMLTQSGMVIGSPGYLSPEQAEGRPVGPPGDVFSLGAVLAYAASGDGPFGTGPAVALAFRVVHAAPDLSGVPEQLRPLISHCLAKDPAARPTPGTARLARRRAPGAALAQPAAGCGRCGRLRAADSLIPPASGRNHAGLGPGSPKPGQGSRRRPGGRPDRCEQPPRRSRRQGGPGRDRARWSLAAAVAGIALATSGQGSGTAPPAGPADGKREQDGRIGLPVGRARDGDGRLVDPVPGTEKPAVRSARSEGPRSDRAGGRRWMACGPALTSAVKAALGCS